MCPRFSILRVIQTHHNQGLFKLSQNQKTNKHNPKSKLNFFVIFVIILCDLACTVAHSGLRSVPTLCAGLRVSFIIFLSIQCDFSDVAKRSFSIIASGSAYCIALVPGHYCVNRRGRIRKHTPPVPARLSTAPWTFHSISPSAAETPPHTTIHHIQKSISCTLCHSHKTAVPPWSSQKGRWNIT